MHLFFFFIFFQTLCKYRYNSFFCARAKQFHVGFRLAHRFAVCRPAEPPLPDVESTYSSSCVQVVVGLVLKKKNPMARRVVCNVTQHDGFGRTPYSVSCQCSALKYDV